MDHVRPVENQFSINGWPDYPRLMCIIRAVEGVH